MSKQINIRIDLLTELLLENLQQQSGDKRTQVIKTAVYQLALQRLTDDEIQSIVRMSFDSSKL